MKLPESWTENCADLLRAFNKEGVEYLLFGSMAESHYRSLASVGDMDVLINPTPENATKVKPAWGLSRNRVKNYSKGPLCDLPGVTSGTASAAMKRPFFGAWASGTTATVMAKKYRLWPCRNRPREGPENLAKIETRAMRFLATPKAKPVHSLASASTPDFGTSDLA